MLLTRHFVFIHVPKTGGTFVRGILREHSPKEWELTSIHDHATVRDIPASHAQLPRLTLVRNPFSWYVSWFHFHLTRDVWQTFFDAISDHGRLDFAATMRRVLGPGGMFADSLGPYMQSLFEQLGEGAPHVRFCKLERVREDFVNMVEAHCPVPEGLRRAFATMPAANPSEHRPWRDYYDDVELRRLVETKEAFVLRHFGYSFDGAD